LARKESLEKKSGPRNIVDRGRNLPPPEQSTGCRGKKKTTFHLEPGKDERRRIDVLMALNAKME
jgi:hypothetical protein